MFEEAVMLYDLGEVSITLYIYTTGKKKYKRQVKNQSKKYNSTIYTPREVLWCWSNFKYYWLHWYTRKIFYIKVQVCKYFLWATLIDTQLENDMTPKVYRWYII